MSLTLFGDKNLISLEGYRRLPSINLGCYSLFLHIGYLIQFCNLSELFLSFDISPMAVHQPYVWQEYRWNEYNTTKVSNYDVLIVYFNVIIIQYTYILLHIL